MYGRQRCAGPARPGCRSGSPRPEPSGSTLAPASERRLSLVEHVSPSALVKKYAVSGFAFAAAIAVVAILIGAREHNVATWTFGPSTDATPTVSIPADPPPPPPVRARALAIARANPVFRAVTYDAGPHVVLIQPWTGQDPGVRGASLTFRLSRRINVDGDLPRADIPPDAPTTGTCHAPYRQTWLHEQSKKVTEIYVLVDLNTAKVADISTNATRGRLSWVRGKPHPSCQELQNSS